MAAGRLLRRDTELRDNGATRGLRGNYTGFWTLARHRRRRGARAHRRLRRHPPPSPIMHRPRPSPNPQRIGLLLDDRPVQVLPPNLLDLRRRPKQFAPPVEAQEAFHFNGCRSASRKCQAVGGSESNVEALQMKVQSGLAIVVIGLMTAALGCRVMSEERCEIDRLDLDKYSIVAFLRASLASDARLWIEVRQGSQGRKELLLPTDTFETGVCFVAMAQSANARYVGILVERCDGYRFEHAVDIQSGKPVDFSLAKAEVYEKIRLVDGFLVEGVAQLEKRSLEQRDTYLRMMLAAYSRRVPSCLGRWNSGIGVK